jgi:NAD(P)-dependent dehydrogenase (short-subunit alcohol dehydrogenase family)
MRNFAGRVAVITGAASGIGFGLAERFASEGMKLVLADIEGPALATAAHRLRSSGADVVDVQCDVARAEDVNRLAIRAVEAFGAVHVVCNNAGVTENNGVSMWDLSLDDWQRIVGVNLMGVVNGVRTFVPLLLQQDEGYIVNTASVLGLTSSIFGAYGATKHAIVALSESLRMQLAAMGAHVGVSVLCPGIVATQLTDAERNRPGGPPAVTLTNPAVKQTIDQIKGVIATGTPPSEIATCVVDAMRDERLYILPHPHCLERVRQRTSEIEAGRPLVADFAR